jgi:hypothetical protein
MLNDPRPSLVKNWRRLSSSGLTSLLFFCHRSSCYLCNPAQTGDRRDRDQPGRLGGSRLYDSIVIVPTGQRIAHRPQRMQRVSSFSMAEPSHDAEFVRPHLVELRAESNSWLSRMC